ncbi:MAG: SRPBCC family protein [Bacteroidia bacterium]
MAPIHFKCKKVIPVLPASIASEIADTSKWSEFKGYAFLPGIRKAEYEKRTDNMIGARITVENTDGSRHVEEILVWKPGEKITMKLCEFSPPLNRLATHFLEEWTFTQEGTGTKVTRSFQLFPKSVLTRPFLWLISLVFRRAINAHLDWMALKK